MTRAGRGRILAASSPSTASVERACRCEETDVGPRLPSLDCLLIPFHPDYIVDLKTLQRTAQRSARPPRVLVARFADLRRPTRHARETKRRRLSAFDHTLARTACIMGDEENEKNGGRYEGIEDEASGGTSSLSTVAHRPAVPPLACMRYSPRPCVNQDIVDALKPLRDWRFAEYGCAHPSLSTPPHRSICSLCAALRQLEVRKASHTLLLSPSSSLALTRFVRAKRLAHSSRRVPAWSSRSTAC